VRFLKPPLSIEEQADLVINRGMTAERGRLIRRLQSVGYYRLCGYWYHLKQRDDSFVPGSDFEAVWLAYNFDRRLRMVVMEGIERVEVGIKSDLYTRLVMRHGPFAHCDPRNFPNARGTQHFDMLEHFRREARRSKEPFVLHFQRTYDEFPDLPLWAAAQIVSFGTMLTMLNISASDIRPSIAATFSLQDNVFKSWLLTLNFVRNICAHHSRLWNRELALKPVIPNLKHGAQWHHAIQIHNNRVFVVLTLLQFLQRHLAPRSEWRQRVFNVFDSFPGIPLGPMGMQANWREHPLWSR
jgi:abortive infection bacteriophage resistance protein